MAEITEAGYENLRDHIEGVSLPWKYIELQDVNGAKIVRREVGGAGSGAYLEPREDDGATIVFRLVVIGSDADMPPLPVVAHQSIIKDTDSDLAPSLSTETLEADFSFLNEDCQLTVYHKIEVPDQV